MKFSSKVEEAFYQQSILQEISTITPYIVTSDFSKLGLLNSLRFIEWISENPEGVICLPTDKHSELFSRFTHEILDNWQAKKIRDLLTKYGLGEIKKPSLKDLYFVQSDEFYPISPKQHNSAYNFVKKNYIEGFNLKSERCMLINSDEIMLSGGRTYSEIFPDLIIDLSLRYREAKSKEDRIKKDSIFMIDDWCSHYEHKIRRLGGIGFYLGSMGPDGHIAYNVRGSDLFTTTRMTQTNFETQADAASNLGGIDVAKNRLVITIGLETLTYNPESTVIIYASGEANADIVKQSLENKMTSVYPATALQRLKNARFYLTEGAASKLNDALKHYYTTGEWNFNKTERSIIDLCNNIDKYAHHLTIDDLKVDKWCSMIPNISEDTVKQVVESIKLKLKRGYIDDKNQVIYHTGPHHDDIMLGIMPYINRQLRPQSNDVHFAVATSGYNSVTNRFVMSTLKSAIDLISQGKIQMINYPNFFSEGYQYKRYKDVYHFLDACAQNDENEKMRGLCHRVLRDIVEIWNIKNIDDLLKQIFQVIEELKMCYDGGKNSPNVQRLKGRLREFEEELVWNYNGVKMDNIHHLRLGFYKGDTNPDNNDDVNIILNQFLKYNPSIISVAFDPEGSGPDTHYKVLQAVADAIVRWNTQADLSQLRIIGYRNVWFKFHPAEADIIVPVSLNDLAVHEKAFKESYLTQVEAAYPSPECDGPFSEISRRIWVKQLKQIQHILGKNYFYENENALIRATHGLIYLKEMNVKQFLEIAKDLKKRSEGTHIL